MDHVKVNLEPLRRFASVIRDNLASKQEGPIRDAIHQWAAIYRSAMGERFVTNSRGGGDWPPLAESTKRQRRGPQQKSGGKRGKRGKAHAATGNFTILTDTGLLRAVLLSNFVGTPGYLQEDIPFGVKVGFGGPSSYPAGGATIADIASFHQSGGGHLPQRKILVEPPPECVARMVGVMEVAIAKVAKDVGN